MSTIQGTIVAAKITTGDTTSTYPIADQTEIKGGHHSVATSAERNAIPSERREEGMTCYVAADGIIYQLKNGITNSDWIQYEVVSEQVKRILASADDPPTFDISTHLGVLYFKYFVGT